MEKSADNPAHTLEGLRLLAHQEQFEDVTTYRAALDGVLTVFASEDGLITLPDLPTIIVPDLHARREFLFELLATNLPTGPYAGGRVFDLLRKGLIAIVCVGDIMHSEQRSHWVINDEGEWTEELLEREMVRSLGTATMIMYLKTLYPQHFHCLRGNHDDMACELARDFTKFVGLKYKDDELVLVDGQVVKTGDRGEARLIKDWVLARAGWGEPFLNHWSLFERSLPLLARSSYFVVSHTLPLIPLTEDAIRDRERPREITIELTSRRGIQEEAIRGTLNNLGLQETIQRWFYGHSPVPASSNNGRFEEGLDGLLVRFNNPRNYVFAYVPSTHEERRFQADSDVYIKTPTEETFHQ